MNKALDYHVRQFIFTCAVTFTPTSHTFDIYSEMQRVTLEHAMDWLDANLYRFEVTLNTGSVPDHLPPLAHQFFERYSRLKMPRSYYCIDLAYVTHPMIKIVGPSRKSSKWVIPLTTDMH